MALNLGIYVLLSPAMALNLDYAEGAINALQFVVRNVLLEFDGIEDLIDFFFGDSDVTFSNVDV